MTARQARRLVLAAALLAGALVGWLVAVLGDMWAIDDDQRRH